MGEGTIVFVTILPFPWPPPHPASLLTLPFGAVVVEIRATERGNLWLRVTDQPSGQALTFLSQQISVAGSKPRPVQGMAMWDATRCWLRLSSTELIPDGENAPHFSLAAISVPTGKSFDSPDAIHRCQQWMANRATKFVVGSPRPNRRLKTIQEEADTLRESVLTLRHFNDRVRAGDRFLIGHLAAELRALVYWQRDAGPDRQYKPLLLRMASKANLPLPVYALPEVPPPLTVPPPDAHVIADLPRIDAVFPTDQIYDLQDVLKRTALRIGANPGATILALEMVAEFSHTLGAAHYDEDASDFIDLLSSIKSGELDQAQSFMCSLADTVADLADWVVSELVKSQLVV